MAEHYDVASLPEEEYTFLDNILSACIQLAHFKQNLGLDISEVDVKKYTLEDDYRGKFFDLKALDGLFKKAENGHVDSMMYLAAAFNNGDFSPGLSRYAARWCEKAAEAGDVNAMIALASFYRWGEGGVFVNAEKAIYWYGKAAELGNEDAISFMEQFGDGSDNAMLEMSAISGIGGFGTKWYKSERMIVEWYKNAEDGDAEAQYELGRQLMPGTGYGAFRRNIRESIKYYEMAAERGMIDAMFNLANAYNYGWSDMEPDSKKEFYWRKKAADAGDVEAAYMLGKMYMEEEGTYMDFEEGLRYLKTAADSGEAAEYMIKYYDDVCEIDKIFEENKEYIVPVNSDFYEGVEESDRKYLQEYLGRIMYDMICAEMDNAWEYALSTYNHVITLVEMAVRASKPVLKIICDEYDMKMLDLLVRRMLYHYLDSIEGNDGFYDRLEKGAGVDIKKHRKECHEMFFNNMDNSIASVQKDFPEFMEDWIFGVMS